MILRLRVSPPRGAEFEFSARRPVVMIGRNPEGDISFTDAMDNVSWEHAKIKVSNQAATLSDLDSTNGTFLNGNPSRLKSCALKIDDEFQLGQSGPKFRVLALELNHAGGPPTPPRSAARSGSRPPPLVGSVSHTRALLIESQSRQRRLITALAALFLALVVLIAAAIWLIDLRGRSTDDTVKNVEKTVGQQGTALNQAQKKLDDISADMKTLAQNFDDSNKRNDELRQDDRKRIDLASADARRFNQELLEEFRRKQAQGQAVAAGDKPVNDLNALNRARGGAASDDGNEPPLELTPGMVLSIRKRNSANTRGVDYENAALATATGDALYLKWIDDSNPKKIAIEDIETLFVKNQMYTFNPTTNRFEPGLAYFRLEATSGMFTRAPRQDVDLSTSERGIIDGETSTQCFVNRSTGMHLVLPKARFGSTSFEAKIIATITTNYGVYTWLEGKREYEFNSHQSIAKNISAERDRQAKEQREDEYKKKVERYKLATDRLKALRPYWWWWW